MTKSTPVIVVGVHEAKTHFSELLRRVAAGEQVEITNRGEVVAHLVGPEPPARPQPVLGIDRGNIWMAPDFDEYGPELQEMFEGSESRSSR